LQMHVTLPQRHKEGGTVVPYYKYMFRLGRSASFFLTRRSTTSVLTV
jgi:hypothetical protein